jgi:acyl transferase domain-containing protein/NADPH:quinone reductase-like Zn-dependent oxidoreductase/NAD(P)-dependent dehydrogenase (short-subunit alcohol dehydrogenase family)
VVTGTVEAAASPVPAVRSARLLPLSGKTDQALAELAGRYLDWLDERTDGSSPEDPIAAGLLADMARTAGVGRSHFSHRAGVVFSDASSLRESLEALASGDDQPPRPAATRVAFAYTGQASQWVGMGRVLYECEPVFRSVLDRCDTMVQLLRGASLLNVMFGSEEKLDDPAWTQPCIYAIECALTALWSSIGVHPDVVVGHSLGEIAAARAAGAFSLEDGLRFAAARGALMGSLPEDGAMAAIFATPERVAAAVNEFNTSTGGSPVGVAADNGMHQVISGPADAVESLLQDFEAEKAWVRRLRRSPAYHSALVEPALDDLQTVVDRIETTAPSITYVSSMTGQELEAGQVLDGRYWRNQARAPVAFRTCVETLAAMGVDAVIEIGPDAVLGPTMMTAWPQGASTVEAVIASSMRRPSAGKPDPADGSGFLDAVAVAYGAGIDVSFEGLFAGETRRRIALPGYRFQHHRHWVERPRRRRRASDHRMLGTRHDSPRGETLYATEMFVTDPAWLGDHRVYRRVITPGALYGSMAAAACSLGDDSGEIVVEDFQLHSPMIFDEHDPSDAAKVAGRNVQFVLDGSDKNGPRRFEVFSQAETDDGWTLHAQGMVSATTGTPPAGERPDLEELRADFDAVDIAEFYRARASAGVDLGGSFRTLAELRTRDGEALGEVILPDGVDAGATELHPLLLDGCFQVMAAARRASGDEDSTPYLPFGWERLELHGPLPERLVCHALLREPGGTGADGEVTGPREVIAADLRLYACDGTELGRLDGYTVKRATRAALLSATESLDDLLYEVVWRDRALPPGIVGADFLASPAAVAARSDTFAAYLEAAGVDRTSRADLLKDLERLSWSYALMTLERLGWQPTAGGSVEPDALREQFGVLPEHSRLFRRLFEMLARADLVEASGDGFVVVSDPEGHGSLMLPANPEAFGSEMADRYEHGSTEIGLFRRSAGALAEVLVGDADPLTLLFSSGEPTAADLYLKAPVARAANQMLADAVATLLEQIPDGRRLRVIEVGAGTGSATAAVMPQLPTGRFDYTYTDISAGFFAEAEDRFGGREASIEYRVLDIERDPGSQAFEHHAYDLVIASNVLHATRYLSETLQHCRDLLAPSGHLVALENLRGQGWLDLTFGQLDGWWRFADSCRPHHALASPAVWRQALDGAGFKGVEVLGADEADPDAEPDRGVILAQGPAEVAEPQGVWILAADRGGLAAELAERLAALNQTVVLASDETHSDPVPLPDRVVPAVIDMESRTDWLALLDTVPPDLPFNGVVHLTAADTHGVQATTSQMATAVRRAAASSLALMQGLADADATAAKGVWFVTRGGQVLEHECVEGVAGAVLWGFGKVAAREASHLQPRMIDLDPVATELPADICDEFLHPDAETHVAYRGGHRQAARLVRSGTGTEQLRLPDPAGESRWLLEPDEGGALEELRVEDAPVRSLEPGEVRVAVEATGLNFWDMFRSLGVINEGLLGGEFCGRVLEVGPGVSTVHEGDRVVGLAFGTFSAEAVTREEMVAQAPPHIGATALATMPTAFVSAALSFDLAELKKGERVLIHAAAGGVGLAAVQLAQAAGAEVFATASAPKQAYLRSLGVEHVFDSRSTSFGDQILEATGGAGVDVVLNSLTGPGFIDASLSCLARGGRFVELARVDILSHDEMARARPDAGYWILELDALKEHDPARPGDALRRVMQRLAVGELAPLVHTRWSLAEVGAGMKFMRAARHIGKIVFAASPLETGRLRCDRTYLVTGGLGGIGCTVAGWLFDRGAGAIVLHGRRDPDPEAAEAIAELRERGATVSVELADITDTDAVDAMLARISNSLPPLAGVIHSVGVLSDAALTNQSWESFERVLWPKVLGAWHLHRATEDRDLDMFVLFSSVAGVLGNPGQANHAAANAFLDVLAAHRRSLGLAGQSIAWGAWSGLGEAEEQRERIAAQLEAAGTGWITPQHGLRAFDHLVRQDTAAPMVANVDWQMVADDHENRSPLLEDLLAAMTSQAGSHQDPQSDLLSELAASPATEHEQTLAGFLQRELQAVMRLPDLPGPSVEFADLGMDSLMAVELRNRINRGFAGAYTAGNTVVFDYPSVQSLAAHLASELRESSGIAAPEGASDARFAIQIPVGTSRSEPDQAAGQPDPDQPEQQQAERAAAPEPAAQVVPPSMPVNDAIAIVGMACRFPGAEDLRSFWHQLEAGENAITDGRADPGPWNGASGDPANPDPASRVGAYVEGIDGFDAGFFGIRPIEARMMDPQQRMLLETTWQALEDAAIDPTSLKRSRTGVYAGIGGSSEYRRVIAAAGRGDSYFGTTSSVAVGRIAFTLGLAGPAVPFDLACASSLVAVHHAVSALRQGEVDLALAGGANAVLSPSITKFLAETQMLSASGQCRAFDAAADGYVRGEGCGMVALKRLEDAIADGDRIWAVVRGTAVNQNATGLGLTQPNGPAQMQAMEQALARAAVAPADVDYLEAHGPGSRFGDAVEMNAAATVYGKGRGDGRPLLVGSVKTNIGHLECASAVAGLIKTVLAMNRGRIPKHLHLCEPSEQIDWKRLPVRVTTETTDWPATPDRPRLAAVNSFAISGANAHLVLQGHDTATGQPGGAACGNRPQPERRTRLLPLSARSGPALCDLAARYLEWINEHAARFDAAGEPAASLLGDMAWTASVGRAHFSERAGVVFDDTESLRVGLQTVMDGHEAHATRSPGPSDRSDAVTAAAADYEAGLDVAFLPLFEGETRRRISLPGYPFERRRHWVEPIQTN